MRLTVLRNLAHSVHRHCIVRPAFVVAGLTACLSGCRAEAPPGPSAPSAPQLLTPAPGVRFRQNDPTIGCALDPNFGYGHRLAFDWQHVAGAVGYRIVYGRSTAIPLVFTTTESSAYERTYCASFVADVFLDGWTWRVGALLPAPDGRRDTLWSEIRENGFAPCRLADGTSCRSP